ncbi:DUF1972 domain-containing protein [Maribacter sp. 2304DJ31-5]|uniref:DUF1972 domain-containing protein n=1 Tax=Maribacter sp. 2304DJ31-5 TaxID=3386273 RepID=UPI0039BD7FC4
MKKVTIIGTVGIPAKYGGFETLAENLVEQLGKKYAFTVYCSAPSYPSNRKKIYLGARLKYLPIKANGKSSILYDMLSMMHAAFFADVILVLGVSGAFMIPIVRQLTTKKIITNIDGLEWKRAKWSGYAKRYLKWQERIAVRSSHTVVVDNKGIEDYVLEEYKRPSNLIAYGGDHIFRETLTDRTRQEFNIPDEFAFKVCRIEPENNIHIILEAFSKSEMNLLLVGNWNNSAYGVGLLEKFAAFDHLHLLHPIYDQKKLNELRSNCKFYVHGHSAGGTNPSLVEAMYLGLPIVAFDVDYNRYTTSGQALYFRTGQDLEKILDDEVLTIGRLNDIAKQMRKEAVQKYTWKFISNAYDNLF